MVYGSVYGSYIHENALADVEPFEFDESMSFMEMGAQTIEESTADWNSMMKAIALTELSYVAETGQELIYEAVDFESIKNSVVKWFQNLWAKIQGIARTALAKFQSFGKNDEAFISKYKQYFNAGYDNIPDGFSFKGYKFNDEEIDKGFKHIQDCGEATMNTARKAIEKCKPSELKAFSKKVDDYRGMVAYASTGGTLSSNEFTKALNKAFRGSDAKDYLHKADINVAALENHVSGAKTAIEDAKEARDTLKGQIDDCISDVNSAAEDYKSKATDKDLSTEDAGANRNASTYFTAYAKYLKDIQSVNTTWFTTYISVLKDRNRQSKALLVKIVGYANGVGGKKDLTKTEAASILEDRFAAIFD